MPLPKVGSTGSNANTVPQIPRNPQVAGTDNVANAGTAANANNANNTGNVAPAGEAAPEEEKPRAADLAGHLDMLFVRATKNAAVNAKDVEAEARLAGIPQSTFEELVKAANDAQKCMQELDAFSGLDLAQAMKIAEADALLPANGALLPANGSKQVRWKEDSQAAKAFSDAQKAQEALSIALNKAINETSSAKSQEALEDFMLQCDRRYGELETLALQMAELVSEGNTQKADRLVDGKISAYTSADILDKYGLDTSIGAIKDDIKPLADRLAGYARNDISEVAENDIQACKSELAALKEKFDRLVKSLKPDNPESRNVDRAFIAEVSNLLEKTGKEIDTLHEGVLRRAMRDIAKCLPLLQEPLFGENHCGELHKLKDTNGKTCKKLEQGIKLLNAYRRALEAYIDSPTEKNEKALRAAGAKMTADVLAGFSGFLNTVDVGYMDAPEDASDAFKSALGAFKAKYGCIVGDTYAVSTRKKEALEGLLKTYTGFGNATDHFVKLGQKMRAGQERRYFLSGAVLGVFKGELKLSPLLEARVHGYEDGDVNTMLDDRNVAKTSLLGTGNYNSVTSVRMKDGSRWAFKPEFPGVLRTGNNPHTEGMSAGQQFSANNLAVQDTADALGLGDVLVKTSVGMLNGAFGMYMEMAPGVDGWKFANPTMNRPGGQLDTNDLRALDDDTYTKIAGRAMRQFNRLNWADILTGQGDRNGSNYMIAIDRSSREVTVKGIDNDSCYSNLRTGLYTYRMPAGTMAARLFGNAIERFRKDGYTSAKNRAAFDAYLKSETGIRKNSDGSYDIDLSKAKNKPIIRHLLFSCGFRDSAPPTEIDKDLYDRLVALDKNAVDPGPRKAYLAKLAKRIGADSDRYKCAVSRLDDAIAHARRLNDEGKVYDKAAWETANVVKSVCDAQDTFTTEFPKNLTPQSELKATVKRDNEYMGATNIFMRGIYQKTVTPRSHPAYYREYRVGEKR